MADNGSTDGSVEAIRSAFPDVEVVENGANLGFSGGNNAAIRRALDGGAEWVVLLNNDAEAEPGLLDAFRAAAARHPHAGVLAGKLLFPDGRVQWAGQRVGLRTGYSGRPRGHGREDGFAFSVEGRTQRAVGALMAVSRAAIERAGLLDEDLFAYVEDVDWSLRIRAAGFECVFVPAARAVHRLSASTGGASSTATMYYGARNTLVVCERHAPLGPAGTASRRASVVGTYLAHAALVLRSRAAVEAVREGYRDALAGGWAAENGGWVGIAGPAARQAQPRAQRALVDLGGRSCGGGPRELGGAGEAGRPKAVPFSDRRSYRVGDRPRIRRVEVDRRVAGHLAQHRQLASTRPARRAPSPRARAGRSPRSASAWPRPRRRRRAPRDVAGRRRRAAAPRRRAPPPARRARRCPCRGRRTRAAGGRRARATPSISAARFLCGRSEATLSTTGRSPWPRSAGGGGSGGGGVTPLGTTSTFRIFNSDLTSAAEAWETVMTRRARRAAPVTSTFVPSRIAVGTASGSRRQRTSCTVSTRGGPPASGPKFATECRRSSPRAARGSRSSSPAAHDPRATPEESTRTTRAASVQNPSPVVSRLTSAVSSRSGRSATSPRSSSRA